MSFRSTLLAASALLASANAHIIMEQPVPYSVDKIDNGPISASQFPCKSQNGFDVSKETSVKVGEQQTIKFKGTAVHNGGLCQLSVALTQNPTADTDFKVIKTIEGGCPGLDGGVKDFNYELPDSIPNGKATFAWTWMPVSSGGPEFYMNCAPIDVSGGASDDSKFSALPDMLVANLPGKTTCTQQVNTVLQAPNPGENVEKGGGTFKASPPTGDCGASGSGGGSSGGDSSSDAPEAPSSSASAEASASSAAPSNPGGVFAPGATGGASQSTTTTLVTVTGTPSAPSASAGAPTAPAEAPSAPAAAPAVPVGTGAPAAPAAPAPTGSPATAPAEGSACSNNGAIVCNGEKQFGLCNNGQVVWQEVAAGTSCHDGKVVKRSYNGRIVRPRGSF